MSKARDLADFISTGAGTGILADGAIDTTEITGVTVSSAEINRLAGVGADVQTQINAKAATSSLAAVATSGAYADVTGTPSLGTAAALNVGTAASNIPQLDGTGKLPAIDGSQLTGLGVTQGTLTKTFTQNETAEITLGQAVTPAPVVSVTKEVPQTGVSTKGNWDVNSTASNYDFHNTAANVTLTPSSVGYDISSASYDSVYVSTGVGLNDVAISSDGTRIYYVANSGYVYQRTLSTAFDLSTAGSATSYDHSTQDNSARDITFKTDGYKMYVTGDQNNRIFQYSLSTAWDVTTASYDNKSFHTANQTSNPYSTQFKSDGTKMYVKDGTRIYEYNLSTAWDVTTVSYTSNNFTLTSQDSDPRGIFLKPDGTKMYMVGSNTDQVYEYNFGTAWDLSTLSYSNNSSPSLTSSNSLPLGLTFSSDGTKMYLVDNSSLYITQYSTAQAGLVLGSGSFASTDVGKRIVGNGGDVILTSTGGAFDTTGGSAFTDNSTIAAGSWSMFGLKSAGDVSGITMPSIGTNTATYDSQISVASQTNKPMDVDFNLDGTKAFVVDRTGNAILQYNLSTAYLLSSASNVYNFSIASQDGNGTGVFISETKMIVCGYSSNKLHLYNLGGTYQFSGGSGTSFYQDFDLNTNGSYSNGTNGVTCQLDASGNIAQIFTVSQNDTNVRHWTPAALNQVSNLTLTRSLDLANVSGITGNPQGHGIRFNNDGTKLFIVDEPNEVVYRLGLTTAYNISTASHEITFDISANSSAPTGIALGKDNDSLMFITTNTGDYLQKYNLASNFTQPTAQYNVGVTNTSGRIDSQYFTDINSMTAAESAGTGTAHYAVSTDGRTTWSVAKGTDGVRPIVRNNSGTWQYNSQNTSTQTGYDFSTFAYANSSLDLSSSGLSGGLNDITIKDDGTKIYFIDNNGMVRQHTLSTAYDLSTAGSIVSFNSRNEDIDPRDVVFKPDGTKMYVLGDHYNRVSQYALSTAWDVSTASYENKNFSIGQTSAPMSVQFKSDGTIMYVKESSDIYQYTLSTAWDVSTASYAAKNFDNSGQDNSVLGMFLKPDGTKMYTIGTQNDKIYEYNFGTAWDLSTLSYSNNSYSLDSANGGARGITISSDGTKIYIADYDNTAIYQYNFGLSVPNFVTTPTWSNGTVNDELYTLQQALSIGANRMDKTQLDAVADANHFSTGSSLDLMIALRMDTAAATLPTSDGVTLNYDAAALNEGAVLGTDYDYFFPANNKVQIKSLAAQNLKVRVV